MRLLRTLLQKIRFKANHMGYDIRPIDRQCWEDQKQLLSVKIPTTIIDAGANRGTITSTYRQLFPEATVYSFEPMLNCFEDLKAAHDSDSKVKTFHIALGEENGKKDFFINSAADTSSLLAPDTAKLNDSYAQALKIKHQVETDVVTLDSVFQNEQLSHVDILKMDVQGGELGILKGATELLRQKKVSLIYTEVYFVPMYKHQPLFGDICSELALHGYKFHYLYNYVFNGRTGRLFQADAIFVCPELEERAKQLLSGFNRA